MRSRVNRSDACRPLSNFLSDRVFLVTKASLGLHVDDITRNEASARMGCGIQAEWWNALDVSDAERPKIEREIICIVVSGRASALVCLMLTDTADIFKNGGIHRCPLSMC